MGSRTRKSPGREKGSSAPAAPPREGFYGARHLRGPRVGSQARAKARDSRSLPEGVPRFESWPTHHPFAPNCARSECTPTRQKVSFRELSPPSTGLRSACFRLRPEGSEQDDHPDEPEADSQCDERHEWLGMAATRVRAFLDETESQEHEQQADPDDGQTRRDCETP